MAEFISIPASGNNKSYKIYVYELHIEDLCFLYRHDILLSILPAFCSKNT